jgi:hypothetical protein
MFDGASRRTPVRVVGSQTITFAASSSPKVGLL